MASFIKLFVLICKCAVFQSQTLFLRAFIENVEIQLAIKCELKN